MKKKISSGSSLHMEVLGQFRIIFRTVNKHFDNIEKSVGISGVQVWALSEIEANPDMTITDLSNIMSLHQSTTSNLLEKLESGGLVKKITSKEDKRVVRLCSTKKGSALLAKSPGPHRGILPDTLMRMEKSELMSLKNNLDKLINTLEHKSKRDAKKPLGDLR